MASNIKVALQLDDKDYQTRLKAAETSTKAFGANATSSLHPINAAFDKLSSGAATLQEKMQGLGAAMTGLAFGAFIASIAQSAAAVKDLSESFGLTLSSTLELEQGFKKAGRGTDDMVRMMATLTDAAQSANDGNYGLRDSFDKMGISMDDLKKKDMPTIMRQIAQVMVDNKGNAEVLTASWNILGKSAKGIPWDDFIAGFDKSRGKMDDAARGTEAFDAALKRMEASAGAVKREFMILITPVVELFNTFMEGSDKAKLSAELLAVAMGVFTAGAAIVGINAVRTAILGLGAAFGISTFAAGAETAALGANTAATVANAVSKEAGLVAKVASLTASVNEARAIVAETASVAELAVAQRVLETTTWRLVAAKAALAEASAVAGSAQAGQAAATAAGAAAAGTAAISWTALAAGMLRIVGVAAIIATAIVGINAAVKAAFDTDPIDFFATKLEKLVFDNFPRLHAALEKVGAFFGMAPGKIAPQETSEERLKRLGVPPSTQQGRGSANMPQAQPGEGVQVVTQGATGNLSVLGENAKTLNPMAATEESLRAQARLRELNNALDQTKLALQKEFIGKDDYERAVRQSAYDFEVKKLQEINRLNEEILKLEVTAANDKEGPSKYAGQLAILRQQLKVTKDQTDNLTPLVAQLETAKLLEKARLQDLENMVKAYDAQIARQQKLSDILVSAHRQAADVKDTISPRELVGLTPLQKQIIEIQESTKKAAREAARNFADAFGEIETPQQAQEFSDGLDQIAAAYKKVGDAQIELAKTTSEVQREFMTGWQDAFTAYVDSATNAAQQASDMFNSITSNMNNAIDSFVTTGKLKFGDFARSVIQDLLKIQLKAAVAGVFKASGIGSLFGFADGGLTDMSPMIVGERGPELFVPKSAGRIIPNNQLGSGQQVIQNTYVTNNVSAIDAKSVAQLFYENRLTLYGNVQMAQKELPMRTARG